MTSLPEKTGMAQPPLSKSPPSLLAISLYAGFALTGIGCTLLGCMLPALTSAWHLNDSRSGALLAAQFAGASCGALIVRSNLFASILQGYLLMVLCSTLIAFCHDRFDLPFLFLFGLGLGSVMTATSMLMARIHRNSRAASLSLLNAVWGLGAMLSPAIVTLWTRRLPATALFLALAAGAAAMMLLVLIEHKDIPSQGQNAMDTPAGQSKKLLLSLGLLAFLYVGVEASIGNWMMTFIHRIHITNTLLAPIATSLFWMALVAGRAAAPIALRRLTESSLLTISISMVILGSLLLLAGHASYVGLISAIVTGLMLGPIFPLCLARVLAVTSKPSESKWVFAVSGLGGAAFSWITGQVSSFSGSLRLGLLAPLFGSSIMLLLHFRTAPSFEVTASTE